MGLREEFEYIECSNCGCLFIKEIPKDISKYYDETYNPHLKPKSFNEKVYDFGSKIILSDSILTNLIPKEYIPHHLKLINKLESEGKITKESSILDIGCGNGNFLSQLKGGGFKKLIGIDLFVEEGNFLEGINLIQTSLEDFSTSEKFDLIVSNHAFEHMDNQLNNLKCFESLIHDDGLILLRIPIKSEPIWKNME